MSPIAETTTTRSLPAARSRAIRRATRLIRSASATDEPPNFWTTSDGWHGRGILPCGFRHSPEHDGPVRAGGGRRWPGSQYDVGPTSPRHPESSDVLRPRQPPAHRADRRRRPRRDAADADRRRPATGSPRSGPAPRSRAGRRSRSSPMSAASTRTTRSSRCGSRSAGIDALAIDWFGRTAGPEPRGDEFDYPPHVDADDVGGHHRPTSRPRSRSCRSPTAIGRRRRPSSRSASAWAAGCRSSPATLGLGLAGVIGMYGTLVGPWRERRPGAGRRRSRDRPRRSWACSAAPTPGSPPEAIADVRRGADGGRRRPPARDLPGRPAQLLRPQGDRVRRRQRGGLGRGPRFIGADGSSPRDADARWSAAAA